MNNQDIRTLKILEEIENSDAPSQRDMARTLDVSLGLVNSFIKRLARMGYFKVSTIPANRVKYILTPKGAAEKTRLTYEYIKYSFEFYKNSRHKLKSLFKKLESSGVKRVVFFGISDLAEIAYIALQETDIELVAVVDQEKNGQHFIKYEVIAPSDLCGMSFDKIVITGIDSAEEYRGVIRETGVSEERIIHWQTWD